MPSLRLGDQEGGLGRVAARPRHSPSLLVEGGVVGQAAAAEHDQRDLVSERPVAEAGPVTAELAVGPIADPR